MSALSPRPDNAVAFVRSFVGYDWQLANGRYQSCYDWRAWLRELGGECEFELGSGEQEPDEVEFAELMGWYNHPEEQR